MIKKIIFAAATLLLLSCGDNSRVIEENVLPTPMHIEKASSKFTFDGGIKIEINAPVEDSIRVLQALTDVGITANNNAGKSITLLLCDSVAGITSPEGYRINTTTKHITAKGTNGAGLFYAVQTIAQLYNAAGSIPCGTITDQPRFEYRGLMLDVSRHFFGKEYVKKQIDAIARYKMNRLHLHLTDAAGWRVEIKQYPRLTQFAAWRSQELWKDWWYGDRQYREEGAPDAHGGYYTQEDIREIVQYAADRYITVIPEIEMPAHSEEVLTAYPQLSCTHEPYKQADFCVGNEEVYTFLENVLTEIMEDRKSVV